MGSAIKGIFGQALDWNNDKNASDSVDSFRFRNFSVNLNNGRGAQIDFNYNLQQESGLLSYSLLQALPKYSVFNLYPLAGLGLAIKNDSQQGYQIPGTAGLIGMYGKATVTDKIWLNYNPIYMTALSGSDDYKANAFGSNQKNIMTHEATASYQITPIMNVRYFANWSEYTAFSDGDHRIELNYQF